MGERYKDRVAIVTGGASGIGEGISRVFGQSGAKVVVFDIQAEKASKVCQEISDKGSGSAEFLLCDLLNEENIKSCIQKVADKYGRIDCVVNNAGWHPPGTLIDDVTSDDYTNLFKLNQLAPLLMSKYALPHLRKVQGNIINMSSYAGVGGQKEATCYSATKAAIIGMTKSLAIDEGKYKVRVNAISPGAIDTPLMQEWASGFPNPEQKMQEASSISILNTIGSIEDVGKLALYLAADADYVTGANYIISGGYELPKY